ncbi:MAG: glycerol-3-phosphate 1-O-acyltransferase PlsY [Candidatus Omnitrophica bacterium]|nr:glycerol-3-phosphate 1-O-acyltransferase PlsY [Candidatus Omnitrophota bacterium]
MTWISLSAYGVLAYFLGSLPFGLWVGRRVKGIDIREHGSKNTGATNVFRVVGKKWGFLVLFLDALKGALAVILPGVLSGAALAVEARVTFAILAILGHSFSIWMSWKGGKGVATSLGVFLALSPIAALLTLAVWGLVFFLTRIISLASLSGAVFFPIAMLLVTRGTPEGKILIPLAALVGGFIFFTHRANLGRILRGEEKKII